VSLLAYNVARTRAAQPTRRAVAADLVEVNRAELAALRAIAAAALTWADGLTGADPIHDAVRRHRAVLDPDPGYRLAWPDEEPEPVAGINYLPPVGDHVYDRDDPVAPDGEVHDRHTIGYGNRGQTGARWYDANGRAA
jgi:hypothetical protein